MKFKSHAQRKAVMSKLNSKSGRGSGVRIPINNKIIKKPSNGVGIKTKVFSSENRDLFKKGNVTSDLLDFEKENKIKIVSITESAPFGGGRQITLYYKNHKVKK